MTRRPLSALALAAPLALSIPGCTSHPLGAPVPGVVVESQQARHGQSRKLDVLFMVDNSASMQEEQQKLVDSFPDFMRQLDQVSGGADLRIGVVSSDVGAGGATVGTCAGLGDAGRFQLTRVLPPLAAGEPSRRTDMNCGLVDGASWIAANGGRATNLQPGQTLNQVFSCMAERGVGACGFEHQLESVRRAVAPDAANPGNAGFLRPDAYLAIVIITDEDDCSAGPDAAPFFTELRDGDADSLRCATEGHVCDGRSPTGGKSFSAPLASCRSNESGRLRPVKSLVDAIVAQKRGGADEVFVAAIAGWPVGGAEGATYGVEYDATRKVWDLAAACRSANGGKATPAVRINEFLKAFRGKREVESICQEDFKEALSKIGGDIGEDLFRNCLQPGAADGDLATPGVQPTCVLEEERQEGGRGLTAAVPQCKEGRAGRCWSIVPDTDCRSGLQYLVDGNGEPPPTGVTRRLKCLTCDAPGIPGCPPR